MMNCHDMHISVLIVYSQGGQPCRQSPQVADLYNYLPPGVDNCKGFFK
jgi:hypothetical protein